MKLFFLPCLFLLSFAAVAQEPVLFWRAVAIDASGKQRVQRAYSHAEIQSKSRVSCDPAMNARLNLPAIHDLSVEVRPNGAELNDSRVRTFQVNCTAWHADPALFDKTVPVPKRPPLQEKKMIQLWD